MLAPSFSKNSFTKATFSHRGKSFHFRQMTRPPLALLPTVRAPFTPYAPPAQAYHASRLRRFRQTVFASSAILPAGCMGGLSCPSLLRSVRLWITGTNVVEWDSRRVTRSTVPRCEVQVVMITPGYALAPLTGTPGPANARENPGRSVLHSSDRRCG